METRASLTARFPRSGRLEWIGLRPARRDDMLPVERVEILEQGLSGGHARPGKRAVTPIQAKHLSVIAALAGHPKIAPDTLRRNLSATRDRILAIGTARLRITGPCAPCSRMEAALGPGGYNAMRGHGGWCAEVLTPGSISTGDMITVRP